MDKNGIIRDTTFQSTPSVWRETQQLIMLFGVELFQSTPSVWRETIIQIKLI